jgi:hypothetical protein
MIKKTGIIFALAALMIAAFTVPSLTATANPYEQQVLQTRYDSVNARVGLTAGVMADIVSLVPQASDLNAHVDKLNADLATLDGYVAAVDVSGFNSFVSGTVNPDMRAADQAIVADRTHYREWNVTLATRQQLKDKYDARIATYQSRVAIVTADLGNLRLAEYNDAVAKTTDHMATLTAKGVDVSGIQAVVSGARTSVIGPLQSAVSSGSADLIRAELKDKSLGNGAPYSYHFWAKKGIEATTAIIAKLADNATKAGYGAQIADVNAKIAAARSALDSTGTNPYTAAQQDSVWSNLKAAAEELKTIIRELGGH